MQDGEAEDGHERVAGELLERAAVARDDGRHLAEVAREDPAHRLGVEALAERGRAGDVDEQHGDRPPRLDGQLLDGRRGLPAAASRVPHLRAELRAHGRGWPHSWQNMPFSVGGRPPPKRRTPALRLGDSVHRRGDEHGVDLDRPRRRRRRAPCSRTRPGRTRAPDPPGTRSPSSRPRRQRSAARGQQRPRRLAVLRRRERRTRLELADERRLVVRVRHVAAAVDADVDRLERGRERRHDAFLDADDDDLVDEDTWIRDPRRPRSSERQRRAAPRGSGSRRPARAPGTLADGGKPAQATAATTRPPSTPTASRIDHLRFKVYLPVPRPRPGPGPTGCALPIPLQTASQLSPAASTPR